MAGTEVNGLEVSAGVGFGDALDVRRFQLKSVHYVLSGATATVAVQVSNDPAATVWVDHTAGIVADKHVDIPEYCLFVRMSTTAHTGGQPVALFAGLDPV